MDQDRNVLYSYGFAQETAERIIDFIEENQMDCTWNIYSIDTWIVKDKADPRVVREENIVHAQAAEGTIDDLPKDAIISKLLCMCNPDCILDIEEFRRPLQ